MNKNNDFYGLLFGLSIQLLISSSCLIGFLSLRKRLKIYRKSGNERLPAINWLYALIQHKELVSRRLSLDAILLLRFISFAVKFFSILSLFCIALIFIHYYSPSIDQSELISHSFLDQISITNIVPGSNLIYVHVVFAYIFSFVGYFLLYQIWIDFIMLRRDFFSSPEYIDSLHNRTLMLTSIPQNMKSHDSISNFVDTPNTTILFARDYLELPNLISHHRTLTLGLESVLTSYLSNRMRNSRPYHFNTLTSMDDTIDYYSVRLSALERRIYMARNRADTSFAPLSVCFVSFEDSTGAHLFAKRQLSRSRRCAPLVMFSPDFEDIVWSNLGLDKTKRFGFAAISMFALFIGWILLQSIITGLSSLENWADFFDSLSTLIQRNRFLLIFVQSLLTPILMSILNYILPLALRKIAIIQGQLSNSSVDQSSLHLYFTFQVFLIVSHIVFAFLPFLIIDSQSFFRNVMRTYVALSTTYINFTITALTFFGLELLQAGRLCCLLYRFVIPQTARQTASAEKDPSPQYTAIYGFLTFLFMVGICYALISPLIVIFTTVAFMVAYVCMKHQLLEVYQTKVETGGFFPSVFSISCISLAMFPMLTTGAIGARFNVGQKMVPLVLLSILPFITLAYWVWAKRYLQPQSEFIQPKHYVRLSGGRERDEDPIPVPTRAALTKIWIGPMLAKYVPALYMPEFIDDADFARALY